MPEQWLREHPDATLEEVREEVSRLHHAALGQRRASRVALGALVAALAVGGTSLIYADRVADHARSGAVQEADSARRESDAGLCELIGLLLDADGASGPAQTPYRIELRRRLERAYTAPDCRPPLEDRSPFPIAPTTAPGAPD